MSGHLQPDEWVQLKHHFRVDIDGTQLSFQEVTGLESTTEVVEYRHGDSEDFFPMKRLAQSKMSNITFKKGFFDNDDHLTTLYNAIYDKEYMSKSDGRVDIVIEMLDEVGDAVLVWNCHNCIPTKLTLDGLKSDDNAAAIESMEFAIESVIVQL